MVPTYVGVEPIRKGKNLWHAPGGRGPTPPGINTPREHALAQNLKRGSKWARKKVARAVAEEAEAAESNG